MAGVAGTTSVKVTIAIDAPTPRFLLRNTRWRPTVMHSRLRRTWTRAVRRSVAQSQSPTLSRWRSIHGRLAAPICTPVCVSRIHGTPPTELALCAAGGASRHISRPRTREQLHAFVSGSPGVSRGRCRKWRSRTGQRMGALDVVTLLAVAFARLPWHYCVSDRRWTGGEMFAIVIRQKVRCLEKRVSTAVRERARRHQVE